MFAVLSEKVDLEVFKSCQHVLEFVNRRQNSHPVQPQTHAHGMCTHMQKERKGTCYNGFLNWQQTMEDKSIMPSPQVSRVV